MNALAKGLANSLVLGEVLIKLNAKSGHGSRNEDDGDQLVNTLLQAIVLTQVAVHHDLVRHGAIAAPTAS